MTPRLTVSGGRITTPPPIEEQKTNKWKLFINDASRSPPLAQIFAVSKQKVNAKNKGYRYRENVSEKKTFFEALDKGSKIFYITYYQSPDEERSIQYFIENVSWE